MFTIIVQVSNQNYGNRSVKANKTIVSDVHVNEVYTDPDLINSISHLSGLSVRKVSEIMRYNVLSVMQVSMVTGKPVDSINTKIRLGNLTICFPFPHNSGKRETIFVLRNEVLMEYIYRSVNE